MVVEAARPPGVALPPVSPQVLGSLVQGLGPVGGGDVGGRGLPRALPPVLVGAAAAVGYGALRLCGNPCCGTYTGVAEAGRRLKQCAGCKAVRYCGPDCQRAHWRQGHKAEYRVLQGTGQLQSQRER